MSLQPFIYNFGGGKIQLKYRIIEEKYSKIKRNLFEWIHALAILSIIVIGVWVYNATGKSNVLIIGGIVIIFVIVLTKGLFKIMNRSIQLGTLFLNDNHLIIAKDKQILIEYVDIKSIYFKMHLKGENQGGRGRPNKHTAMQAYSYFLQINTFATSHIIKIENDLFLTEEDKFQFNKGYPMLMYVLEEIYRLYRIPIEEKPRKFNFEAS